jgi:hypothetical protein
MVKNTPDFSLSIAAFVLYIAGGFGIFGGLALVVIRGREDFLGWGEAKAIGYLLICVGLCFSVMGVLFLRLVRNRTNAFLIKSLRAKEERRQ